MLPGSLLSFLSLLDYMTEQTYVLRIDYIMNVIGIVFVGLEFLLSTLQMLVFYRDNR